MGSTDNTAAANVAKNLQSKSSATATPPASGLSAPVGIGAENRPDDVFKVSSALVANGLMTAPQSHADSRLYSSIIGAQERMDSSLKRDGLIRPGGPTEGTFSRLAGQGFVKPAEAMPTTPQPVPAPSTGNAAINAQLTAQSKQAAVADAQAKAMQTAGDVTRTGFQQMQDVKRVQNARDDAARAEARARNLEQQRRERALHDQEQAMRKANAAAADQAARAKQAVSAGLKNLVSQAGTALGAFVSDTSSARHTRESGNPALNTLGKMDPDLHLDDALRGDDRRRDGSGMTGQDEAILRPLPDETISSNQRLATALSKRRGIGDLPRFTTDAINTDPCKAIPEIADLLRQVHAGDPAQAQDLFHQTAQGITPAHRDLLSRLWHNPWGITEFPEKREHGQPRHAFDEKPFDERIELPDGMVGMPDRRTLELRPEDQIDDRSRISNLVYRPDQDKHEYSAEPYYPDRDNPEITRMAAKAGSESHDARNLPDQGKTRIVNGGEAGDHLTTAEFDQLSDREKSRLRFPDQQSHEETSNFERVKRMALPNNKVIQDVPPYQAPMKRPDSAKGEVRAIVHQLGLKPEMTQRFSERDIETLRLFQRFRQLDEKDTKRLNDRLADLGKRDESLLHALVQKKYNAEHYPEEETWSLNDKELAAHLQKLISANPIGVFVKNELKQGVESVSKPYIGGMFTKQGEITGGNYTPHELAIKAVKTEMDRRKGWGERR
jgi:hypothetical protein